MGTLNFHRSTTVGVGLLLGLGWLGCAEQAAPVPPVADSAAGASAPIAPIATTPAKAVDPTSAQPAVTPASTPVTATPQQAAMPTTPAVPPAAAAPAAAAASVTYNKDIRPIMAANCSMACHGPDPAMRAGPVALDTYANVRPVGELVVAAVTSRRMPPWPADPNCRPLRDTPTITDAQRDLFTKWQEAGFPEGSAEDYVPPPPDAESELGEPTRIVEMAQAHTPPGDADEYYCGMGDHTFESDTYIRAIEVIPDQKTMVHHVQVHIVSSGLCTVGDNMYSWRPGGKRLAFSQGDAALLPAGSRFALQMHYNTFGKEPAPDKTRVALWELPAGTKPERVITRVGVSALVPFITPGATESTGTSQNVGGDGAEIIGVSPHAHMIANRLTATLERSGGKTECLTDVPDWSFEWQLDYIFKDPLPLTFGDTVTTVCDYDNTVEHQPTVDGVKRQTPITVGPGEGSSDEMCLHYIWLRRPAN